MSSRDRSLSKDGREDVTFTLKTMQQQFEMMTTLMANMNEWIERQEAIIATLQRGNHKEFPMLEGKRDKPMVMITLMMIIGQALETLRIKKI